MRPRLLTTMVVLLLALNHRTAACLRATLDARAVQWSTLIVQAKLSAVGPLKDLSAASTRQSIHAWRYQTYQFEVLFVLDGSAKVGQTVTTVRFVSPDASSDSSECGQSLTSDQIGKSFVLLLRPEADVSWSTAAASADARTAQIHDIKAFIVVHLEGADDLGADGLADLKNTISDTRTAESQFNPAQAKIQALALAQAADDTEADQAEHTLLEMGPKALDAIQSVLANTATDLGKTRLTRVIKSISPGPISAVQ
jgi:hypothetical protein